ncbi:DUF397 domain-containing protein [Streptosporangium carneum]|uniref:DUF397 domain-containing protein n=1 Tax=Streptosporangium carneum TaxID=47481 RepID=A0A9W6MGT3_9ACTN|nr:DUF397 domain-containing protein [Streptosporangium carneum]GLK13258.1 hypothetical protein GCM10017600_66690 [Streptosporangium carneum]
MPTLDLAQVMWRKSSRSGNGQDCVEVGVWNKSSLSGNGSNCVEVAAVDTTQDQAGAVADRLFLVRDSKDSEGPVLVFAPSEWAEFLSVIKGGGFDDLAVHPKA